MFVIGTGYWINGEWVGGSWSNYELHLPPSKDDCGFVFRHEFYKFRVKDSTVDSRIVLRWFGMKG